MNLEKWTFGLGIVSIALGASEVIAPGLLSRTLGIRRSGLIRAFGVREIIAGVGLLTRDRKGPWVGARIAGDVLDLAVLASALGGAKRRNVAIALAAVAPIVAADLLVGGEYARA